MHTVRQAYQRLEADGLVSIRTRRGTVVLPYHPSTIANQGADNPSFLIGVVLPSPASFYSPFIQAIQNGSRDLRYLPLFCYTFENPYLIDTFFNQLNARQVDGFIFASIGPASIIENPQSIDLFPPIVSVDVPDMPGPRILIDTENAAYRIANHLLEHKKDRIGLITPPLEWPNVMPFFEGYQRALAEKGIEVEPELVARVDGFFDFHGRDGAEQLLALDQRPDAIIGASDTLALGAMGLLQDRGLSIPDDLALAGYNDIQAASLVQPGLTTASIPAEEMGSLALQTLQDLIQGKKIRRKTELITTELVIRGSCGC
jgi:LacI family transcriptional regulator